MRFICLRVTSNGCADESVHVAIARTVSHARLEYGRVPSTPETARRILLAATISIALVIFRVFLTETIRRFRARVLDGIFFYGFFESFDSLILKLAGLTNFLEDI